MKVRAGIIMLAAGFFAACHSDPHQTAQADAGDPVRGKLVITGAQCGACHVIPGIPDAHGLVGPPLSQFGQRTIIAGLLANTPDNLVRWIREPQAIVPGNAMPSSGLTDAQARDAAAYLDNLR